MIRFKGILGAILLAAASSVIFASSASADFGISSFDVQIAAKPPANPNGTTTSTDAGAFTQAGGHPYAIVTRIEWNHHPDPDSVPSGLPTPDGDLRDSAAELPLGLIGNPFAYPQCTTEQLSGRGSDTGADPAECPADSQVGVIHLDTNVAAQYYESDGSMSFPIYNMVPATGSAARFGFDVGKVFVYLDGTLDRREDGSYGIALATRAPQALRLVGSDITFWGVPADERHFAQRCSVLFPGLRGDATAGECTTAPVEPKNEPFLHAHHASVKAVPFLTMPTSCTAEGEGSPWRLRTDSWENPGVFSEATVHSHLPPYAPDPSAPGPEEGTTECNRVPFTPDFSANPTQQSAESPSGLDVHLTFPQDGLQNPDGIAQSHLKKAVVALPEGVTINPSQADGLGVCTPEQFSAASVASFGCPSTAKMGTVEVKTPVLEETIPGNVYVAKPYDNSFGSLLALYVVLREPQRGISIGLPGKVELDPVSGQIEAIFDELPQVPVESFDLSLRGGARSPLVTPQACGTFTTKAEFYPWARLTEPVISLSNFEITSGVGGGPCPSAGLPPFKPGLIAGSINNAAGSYSPFNLRLFRTDEEQEITHFSIKLPPGISGKLAGIPFCSDAAIEAAKTRTGAEEEANPSCPKASEVGHTLVGAGVGSVQAYAPGKVYLAGPYHGSAISITAITAAKVGPFDLGTVVVRQALKIDPETAEVFIDATGSDPIPHIIDGITTHLRDIRAYVDRSDFVLNPTSCDPASTASTVLGSGLDFASAQDDEPVTVSTRYQAADCGALGFKPKLGLRLVGGTKRGAHPALRAVLAPRPGDANASRVSVALPHSEFLDQSHIDTVCTRVQFAAGAGNGTSCPAGSVYGHAIAVTPILDQPLEGPVILRSSEHKLPDLVLALHGTVDFDAVGRIDSINGGGIRNTFEFVPDVPVTKVVVNFAGGRKGLLQNSTNLCKATHRAIVEMDAHNGKTRDFKPAVRAKCAHKRKAKRAHRRAFIR